MLTKHPLDIEFHGLTPDGWIESDIRRRAAKLDTFCRDIMSCRVIVDQPHHHHQSGNRFQLRIEVTVRGAEVIVSHESSVYGPAQDRKGLQLVIREAFDVATRRLRDHVLRRRGHVKGVRRRPLRRSTRAVQASR
jgi:hypothetical protein